VAVFLSPSKIRPDANPIQAHWVASDAGFVASSCSMYFRCASSALLKFPWV